MNAIPAPKELGMNLDFTVEVRPGVLDVAYSLENRSDRRFYVIGRPAPEWDGGGRVVQIDFHHGVVMLSRLLLPQPATMKGCWGDHTPDSSPLNPGTTIADRFQVPLPARASTSR
jgi:hypothetical protein